MSAVALRGISHTDEPVGQHQPERLRGDPKWEKSSEIKHKLSTEIETDRFDFLWNRFMYPTIAKGLCGEVCALQRERWEPPFPAANSKASVWPISLPVIESGAPKTRQSHRSGSFVQSAGRAYRVSNIANLALSKTRQDSVAPMKCSQLRCLS